MADSSENIKDKTYTEKADIKYSSATPEIASISDNTWLLKEQFNLFQQVVQTEKLSCVLLQERYQTL